MVLVMRNIFRTGVIVIVSAFLISIISVSAGAAESAPDFTLHDLSGNKVTLSSLKGKPVLLNFWATWCGYCRKERPHLNAVYNEYKDKGLVVLSVSTDRSVDKVKNYLKKIPADFLVLSDSDGKVAAKYGIRGFPSSFLIDSKGSVVNSFVGYREWTNSSSKRLIDGLVGKE